jgi:two-component system response regulator DctR
MMKAERVLIIEDDPMVIDIHRKVVQNVPGFTVVGTARSGTEGLKAIKQYQPTLVILDIFMPQQNGLEFLKEMRNKGFDMDVIIVTASQDLLHFKESLRYGVVDYLIKPFRLDRLTKSLENYIKMARKIHRIKNVSQDDVDSMVKGYRTEAETPKGLSLYTLNMVKEYFRDNNQFYTADEVANHLGLARVTVRRYLEYLTLNQEIEMTFQYGSIGRPIKRYRRKS